MPINVVRAVRPLVTIGVISALAGAVLVAPSLAVATPVATPPKPTIASVQKQLGNLAKQNAQIVEKFDAATINVAKRAREAAAAADTAVQAKADYNRAHQQFVQVIQAQYEGQSLGATGALLDSSSDGNYLDRLDTLNLISNQTAQVVGEVTDARKAAAAAADRSSTMFAQAKRDAAALAAQKTTVQKQIAKYRTLLATLTVQQQAAFQAAHTTIAAGGSWGSVKVTAAEIKALTAALSTSTSSKGAQAAVRFALQQVGKPYVFGSAGPSSFDCSGLTMRSWQHGGVSLPHSARQQYGYGHHVATSQLLPGDLVFFYNPIGHVTIYIGGGLMVSAPTAGEPVAVVSLNSFKKDIAGATRLG